MNEYRKCFDILLQIYYKAFKCTYINLNGIVTITSNCRDSAKMINFDLILSTMYHVRSDDIDMGAIKAISDISIHFIASKYSLNK